MDKVTTDLFFKVQALITEFHQAHPYINRDEIAFNAIAMFSSTLVTLIAKNKSLKDKIKLLDDLLNKEKEWIKYEHQLQN